MKRRLLGLAAALLIFSSLSLADERPTSKLIFGAIQWEGAYPQEKATSYQASALAIEYINAYCKARNIKLEVYPRPQMGNYFETMDRLRKRKIDFALLPSFIYMASGEEPGFKLLGVMDYPLSWKTIMLVRNDSDIEDMQQLLKDAKRTSIVYVNEMSAAGYLVPKIYFTDLKVKFKEELFSEGHLNSLDKLLKGEYGKNGVIAIGEDVYDSIRAANPSEASKLRKIYSLTNPYIIKDCMFASNRLDSRTIAELKEAIDVKNLDKVPGSAERKKLKEISARLGRLHPFDRIVSDVDEKVFASLNNYLSYYKFKFAERLSAKRILEKIGEDIDKRTDLDKNYKPKIALVLSAGGATGSYQVGVLRAINEDLSEYNKQLAGGEKPLSIDLVVGTSIGALNGIFYSQGKLDELYKIWGEIKPENVFTPAWIMLLIKKHMRHPFLMIIIDLLALIMYISVFKLYWKADIKKIDLKNEVIPPLFLGLIFVILSMVFKGLWVDTIFLFIVIGVGLTMLGVIEKWGKWIADKISPVVDLRRVVPMNIQAVFVTLANLLPAGLMSYIYLADWVQTNTFIVAVYAAVLLAFLLVKGLGASAPAKWSQNRYFIGLESLDKFVILVVGFYAFFQLMSFFKTGTAIFTTDGYEKYITDKLAEVTGVANPADKLQISRDALNKNTLKELVITASDIKHRREVYFYYLPRQMPSPYLPNGPRWVSLNEHPELLIDATIATGSLIVFFPPRKINIENEELALIDGGYLHNIPIDAATLLGATHMIIVLTTEDARYVTNPEKWDFFQYYFQAMDFSTYGTQTLDFLSREKAMSFMISPVIRKIGKADFAGGSYNGKKLSLIDFVNEGYRDAEGIGNGFQQLSAGEFILK